jgi:acyl-CoA hydrolase
MPAVSWKASGTPRIPEAPPPGTEEKKENGRKGGNSMNTRIHVIHRLVKGADLNHHGTLFAGRGAEWFVEAGFIAAASLTSPKRVLCVNIHGMVFKKPVPPGSILRFTSRVVFAGRSRLVSHVRVHFDRDEIPFLEGFLSFVHVDDRGQPTGHGIIIEYAGPEDEALIERLKSII